MAHLLVDNIGELVTNAGADLVGLVRDAAVAVVDDAVVWAGPRPELPSSFVPDDVLDCGGRAVIPGFVDAHTHMVFAGDRSDEFVRRLQGESYEEILAGGGGIHATVSATREAATAELEKAAVARAMRMLRHGTTTLEVKSGYGLETSAEARMLEIARQVGSVTPLDIVTTFLGAHVTPVGMRSGDYVRHVIDEMLPACAPLADGCDVFCDEGAFSVDEARRILKAAAELGLAVRLHAEQLAHTGAARLAAELRASSADHLDQATAQDAVELAKAGTVAVLVPGTALTMKSAAPARMLWDAGVTVAVATDCNPGTSNIESMPLVVALAVHELGLLPGEALWAATLGGATALGLSDRGTIDAGKVADIVVLDAPSHVDLAYRPGSVEPWRVIKRGIAV